jgi:RNA polymerase sigma-70 factor, ECF subfamily
MAQGSRALRSPPAETPGEAHRSDSSGTNRGVRHAALAESDLGLVERASARPPLRAGEAPAVRAVHALEPDLEVEIFSLVYRQMHALYGRWRDDFEDLVQVAAEQALRALPSFRRESELSTWTYRICYRAVLRHRRWYKRWLRRFTLDAPTSEGVDSECAEAQLQERERLARLATALDGLSEKRRAVVVLRDIEGLGIAAIGSIVGASPPTVRSRLRDARRQLATSLKSDPYFGAAVHEEEEGAP